MKGNIMKKSDRSKRDEDDGKYFAIVCGQPTKKLDNDEIELCNFMLGGMLAK